jgi:hypothetical protein
LQFLSDNKSVSIKRTSEQLYRELDALMTDEWLSNKVAIASVLVALRTNMSALGGLINDSAKRQIWPVMSGAQSFFLYESSNVLVRINLWFPENSKNAAIDNLRKYLSIGELHNHDFDFFTICLLGSEYMTHFYKDKKYSSHLKKGDHPDLDEVGIFKLKNDDVLFVERDVDYHLQHWPEDFTVTLNAIPRRISGKINVQYILDPVSLRVKTVVAAQNGET